jgi:uncharacterized protein YqfB (UPF0267 family)
MGINKKQIEKSILDAVKHLEDGRLGTDTDTVELGVWTHEVLDYGDCAESTNECIDMAIELLESVLEEVYPDVYPDSIWILNAEGCKALSND